LGDCALDFVTLSGNAALGAPSVTIDNGRGTIRDWGTVLNFPLVGEGAPVAIPAGAYGNISAIGNTKLVFGVAGATEPSVYDFQKLTLNDAAQRIRNGSRYGLRRADCRWLIRANCTRAYWHRTAR
jgi:hypothetical protein